MVWVRVYGKHTHTLSCVQACWWVNEFELHEKRTRNVMCASHVLEPNEISQIVTSYQIVCGNKSEITREKRIWSEKKTRTQHHNNSSSSINSENFTAVMHLYWVVALNSKSICVNRFQLCFRNRRHLITAETQSDDRIPIWRIHLSKLFDTFVTFENETRKTLLRLISWGDRGAAIYFFLRFYHFCFCKWIFREAITLRTGHLWNRCTTTTFRND